MANFYVNQVRHLYVVTTDGGIKSPSVLTTDKAGSIAVKTNAEKDTYFQYKGAAGLMRSDLLTKGKVESVKVTSYKDMQKELKSVIVTLDKTVNGGNPAVGQDYLVRVNIRQYLGMSDEDYYVKHGIVRAFTGMSKSDFYKTLALSLANNFKREIYPLLDISLIEHTTSAGEVTSGDVSVPVLKNGELQKFTLDSGKEYTGVILNEVAQEWIRGTKEQVPVYFEVVTDTIKIDGNDVIWGVVEATDPAGVIDNGKKIADLEYFCMGDRGDQYRLIGFPNYIPTTYLVNPDLKYNMIDIHYAYTGANEHVQKSEKDLSIAIPSTIDAKTFITAIQTNTGVTVEYTAEAAKDSMLKA